MKTKLKFPAMEVGNFIFDLLFPKKCFGCGQVNTYLCPKCFTSLRMEQSKVASALNNLAWAVHYSDPLVKKLIKSLKYRYLKELVEPLSVVLIDSIPPRWLASLDEVVVIPIPLHQRKLRERGFNQAELLAKKVAEYFSLSLDTKILIRQKYTKSQTSIEDSKIRRRSLKNVFALKSALRPSSGQANLLKDKIIFLVDDVATTDATISEASKILKRAGAKKVYGLVVAKG